MTQEAISELDMDVFAKHIGPYFSWLESKIESGWEQSDHVQKDVLKETRSTSTTMRARFILGVSRTDFVREVERTVELLELAKEAFPQESDEIDDKIEQLVAGIAEKIDKELVPIKYRASIKIETNKMENPIIEHKPKITVTPEIQKLDLKPVMKIIKPDVKVDKPKINIAMEIAKPKVVKLDKPKVKVEKPKLVKKIEHKVIPKVAKVAQKPKVAKVSVTKSQTKGPKKPSLAVKILKGLLYRGGI